MPLVWSIVLMILGGLLAFWLVVWGIPRLLTGKWTHLREMPNSYNPIRRRSERKRTDVE